MTTYAPATPVSCRLPSCYNYVLRWNMSYGESRSGMLRGHLYKRHWPLSRPSSANVQVSVARTPRGTLSIVAGPMYRRDPARIMPRPCNRDEEIIEHQSVCRVRPYTRYHRCRGSSAAKAVRHGETDLPGRRRVTGPDQHGAVCGALQLPLRFSPRAPYEFH
ncbi:hypothetical protein BC628DRAFT_837068 [Trametes gibbosa]|nr:hypothetical protein BC628DRAFT_837068 [Trametes gibbosa]